MVALLGFQIILLDNSFHPPDMAAFMDEDQGLVPQRRQAGYQKDGRALLHGGVG